MTGNLRYSLNRAALMCAAASLLSLGACSRRPRISPEFEQTPLRSIAILPHETKADIPRERVDFIYSELVSQFRGAGYTVLDPSIVSRVCSGSACPEREKLFSTYLVDALVALELESIARNNFLAGYYNSIRGTFRIFNREGVEVYNLKHGETERGGLLFNSGQLIQGVISQVKNSEDDSSKVLAAKFVESLIAQIPRQDENAVNPDAVAVAIRSVSATEVKPSLFEVCADATPRSVAALVVNRRKTNLREVSNGRYCGVYLIDPATVKGTPAVELRSPYGNSVRRELALQPAALCDPEGGVTVVREAHRTKLLFACPGGRDNRFVVYRAPSRIGPYRKVAEVTGAAWTDANVPAGGTPVYAVVAKNAKGERSLPVALSAPSTSAS